MRGNRSLLLLIIVFVAAGLIALFFAYYGNGDGKEQALQETKQLEEKFAKEEDDNSQPIKAQEMQEREEKVSEGKVEEGQPLSVEDECLKIEKDIEEFFVYLDQKEYIKKLGIGEGTLSRFKDIVSELSLHMPVPAGEGLRYDSIISNIYHFYRILDLQDILFIRSVLKNEAEAMEVNLSMFYKWLMSSDECEQGKIQRLSLSNLYEYAGYLINSIGGRAYLFRRNTNLRLLLNYYCLLIIHEADKRKINSYGIDIAPFLGPLAEEIQNYPLLYFRKEYAGNLLEMKDYYSKKREGLRQPNFHQDKKE